MEITEQQFHAYESVREGGLTNMFDLRTVALLSGLDRATILAIMQRYTELRERYMDDDSLSSGTR